MTYLITGGAGFIGSVMVGYLNQQGIDDIIIVDHLDTTEKWKNLVGKKYKNYFDKYEFFHNLRRNENQKFFDDFQTSKLCGPTLETGTLNEVQKSEISKASQCKVKEEGYIKKNDVIIHLGACSATTESDAQYLMENNIKYSRLLYEQCNFIGARFIYASSAATYGDGSQGYSDNNFDLQPLNMYGYSKYLFDQRILDWTNDFKSCKSQVVGLKFFNVYGPNEYHKGSMSSVIYHGFNQIKKEKQIGLFKSYKKGYKDGEQKRDFIYVKDVVKIIDFFIKHPKKNGIFNVGTGKARTFNDLAKATFKALKLKENIFYKDMPESLREKYQYFTEANIEKLRKAGYKEGLYSLEQGVKDYAINYLDKSYKIY